MSNLMIGWDIRRTYLRARSYVRLRRLVDWPRASKYRSTNAVEASAPTYLFASQSDAASHNTIYGGLGVDFVEGGIGSTVIYAGNGGTSAAPATVRGVAGNETLYGGLGTDLVQGGSGTDVLYAGDGGTSAAPTTVISGTGVDTRNVGAGPSQLQDVLSGQDLLFSGTAKDSMIGTGNDTLVAGSGNFTMYGSGEARTRPAKYNDDLVFAMRVKKYKSEPRTGSLVSAWRRTIWFICGATMTLPIVAACQKSTIANPARSIVVGRQAVFRDIKIQPNAITRISDGRFVIAGTGTIARALLTDAQGALLWQYTDPATPADLKNGYRSVFYGAVPLSNGGFLLCGSTSPTGHYEINEITILDAGGRAVERRAEKPNDDSALTSSGFVKCFPWQDGIVLAGYASDGTRGYTWILKLDNDGKKEWQTIFQGTMTTQGGAASSLVFATPAKSAEEKITVIRVNSKGVSVAKRTIPGHRFVQLRTVAPTDTTRVVSYALYGKATLYTLDESLQDAEQPKDIGDFDATQGCGYALSDNSMLLFGHKINAAITWISESGLSRVIEEFDSKYKSYAVPEALFLSGNQFVTARYSASVNPDDNGLVMSWVTIQ